MIAGAPAPYMPLQSVRMLWFALEQQSNQAAALSDADWALYESEVTRSCDANDGVRDGIVENPASCGFDTATLACKPGENEACIAAPQLAMLQTIVAPMQDAQGRAMDDGLFPGVRTRPGPPSPLLRAMWADGVHGDVNWDETTFDRARDLAAADRAMPQLRADSTRIEPFLQRGGARDHVSGLAGSLHQRRAGDRLLDVADTRAWRRRNAVAKRAVVHGSGNVPLQRRAGRRLVRWLDAAPAGKWRRSVA